MNTVTQNDKPSLESRWEQARFSNSYIFGTILTQNPAIAQKIIELAVPDLEIDEIEIIDPEKRQKPSFFSKTTWLDVHVKLKDGTDVMIEMQVAKKEFFIQRLRFYRAEHDVETLRPGNSYGKLNDVIQIAICCFDPVGDDSYIYDYEMYDKVNRKVLEGNGQRLILINATGHKGKISQELKDFLHYVNGEKPSGAFDRLIDDTVAALKYDEVSRGEFMKFEDWLDDQIFLREQEALKRGTEIGIAQERPHSICTTYLALVNAGIDAETAMRKTADSYHITVEEAEKIVHSQINS